MLDTPHHEQDVACLQVVISKAAFLHLKLPHVMKQNYFYRFSTYRSHV